MRVVDKMANFMMDKTSYGRQLHSIYMDETLFPE
jgi:hypothetical protein